MNYLDFYGLSISFHPYCPPALGMILSAQEGLLHLLAVNGFREEAHTVQRGAPWAPVVAISAG